MLCRTLLSAAVFAAVALLSPSLSAQSPRAKGDLHPPFGLNWGETPQRMQALLAGAKGKVVSRGEHGGRTRWVVEGLDQTNLKRSCFYFVQGGLNEVELEYQNPTWKEEDYNLYLRQLRAKIIERFGQGELLTRSKGPVEGEVLQTMVGYRWKGGDTILELIYFSAEQQPEVYRSVSLLYRVGGADGE